MRRNLKNIISTNSFILLFLAGMISANAQDKTKANPYQSEIDLLAHKTALTNAQATLAAAQKTLDEARANADIKKETEALKAEKTLIDAQIAAATAIAPGFGPNFGNKGTLTTDTTLSGDKFHATVRVAESFPLAAKQVALNLSNEDKPAALLTTSDLEALPIYRSAKSILDELTRKANELTRVSSLQKLDASNFLSLRTRDSEWPSFSPYSISMLGAGALLSQIAQFTQLFRTDKSIAFVDTILIPNQDELLMDLIAMEAREKVLYPSAQIESLVNGQIKTEFDSKLSAVNALREQVAKINTTDTSSQTQLTAEINKFADSLTEKNEKTKRLAIFTVIRGELTDRLLKEADGKMLTAQILITGGANLKTSSIWSSNQLYSSGGIAVSYKLISGGAKPIVLKAGVIVTETKFTQIPLN